MRIYFLRLICCLFVKDDYDVEVFFIIMNFLLLFFKRKEVKKIFWIYGSIEEFFKDSLKRELYRCQLDAVDIIVGILNKISNFIKEVYLDYVLKLQIVYNGYDFKIILEKF